MALDYMNRAVAADSNFAEGWAGLSGALLSMAGAEAGEEPELLARADSAARRAIALDDSLAAGHAALGWVAIQGKDWNFAAKEVRRAIDLDPNTPRAFEGLARYHLWVGSPTEQLSAAQRGVEVDPFSHSAVRELSLALAMNGRCDEANAILLPLKQLTPPAAVAGVIRGQCFGAQGKWQDAIDEFQWAMDNGPARTALAFLGHALARAGKSDSARAILEELLSGRQYSHGSFGIASVYVGLGDIELALQWMEKSAADGTARIYLMGPMFDEFRRDPGFKRVRQRLGL